MDTQPNQRTSKQERLRTRWTPTQDKIFADLVLEQIQLGGRPNNVFDQKAWKHIQDQFNAVTGLNFNKKQLRKHLDVLRTRYYNLKSVFEQTGFIQEQSTLMIMPDYEIWGDLIEEQPKIDTQKMKVCPIYDQLRAIFTESGADGRFAQSSHYKELDKIENPCLTISCSESTSTLIGEGSMEKALSPTTGPTNTNATNGRKKRPAETPCHHDVRDQERLNGAIAEAMLEMIAASKLRAVEGTSQRDEQFSISNCIKVLDEIEGVDQSVYFAALDLFDNYSQREMFMCLEHEKRLEWLQANFS